MEVQEEAWPARDDAIAASLPPGDTASFTAGTPAADPAPAAHASSEAAVDVAPYQTAEQDQQQQEGPVTEEQAEQAEELGGAAPAAPSPSAAASEGKASRASFQASRPQSRSRSRGGAASAATARGSRPSSGSLRAPSRGSLAPAPPAELAAALKDLSAKQPSNPISSLNAIRAAAMHSKEALEVWRWRGGGSWLAGWVGLAAVESACMRQVLSNCILTPVPSPRPAHRPQLRAAVPLVVRATRAPRLGTMRAAILTLKDLFLSYGDALCAAAADDTSPTSSGVLALLQKATGTDLNSRRCADDANAALMCAGGLGCRRGGGRWPLQK